ncbi:hypothetical protein A3Q56_05163 [Intoshia linei]|uniref:Uncharacterized protein n=1 Tax=Intoshia linei TaxID=1819745 RepID=A0A177B117_9BILA|nr:hypothetical protein A3Q56_05163 [Intoshia linei]
MNNAVTMATIGIFSILIIGLLILTIAFIVYTRYTKKTFFQPKKTEKAIKKNSLDYIYNCQILLNKAAPFNSKGSKKKTSHENKTMNIKQNLLCGIAKPIFNSENCHNLSNKISLVKPCCIYQR